MDMEQRFKTLNMERRESFAIVTIPDFAGGDSLMASCSEELAVVCEEIAFDETVRALVLIASDPGHPMPPVGRDTISSSASLRIPDRIAALGFPTIAAISGDAVGFGLELAMACDVRIASEVSRFGLPHICDGSIPSQGGTQRLPRLVGRAKPWR
jgi:enoyl-CoA hydratase/carnithine racemase